MSTKSSVLHLIPHRQRTTEIPVTLSELNKNLDVKVYFKSYAYTIDFRFAVKENDVISERIGNVLSPITSVERNHILNRYTYLETNKTFEDKIGELVNVGYKFYGLADNELSYVKKLNDIDNRSQGESYTCSYGFLIFL